MKRQKLKLVTFNTHKVNNSSSNQCGFADKQLDCTSSYF